MAKPRDDEKQFEKLDGSGSEPIEQVRVTGGGEPTVVQQVKQNWVDKDGFVPLINPNSKPVVYNPEKQRLLAHIRELEEELFAKQRENHHLKARVQKEELTRQSMKELLFGEDTKGFAENQGVEWFMATSETFTSQKWTLRQFAEFILQFLSDEVPEKEMRFILRIHAYTWKKRHFLFSVPKEYVFHVWEMYEANYAPKPHPFQYIEIKQQMNVPW